MAAATFLLIGGPSIVGFFNDKDSRDRQIEESKGSSLTGGEQSDDREARWIFVTNWSLPPAESLEFFIPRLNGDTSCQSVLSLGTSQGTGVRPYTGALGRPLKAKSGNYRQHSLYVGFVTCLLAIAGVVLGRRKGEVLFFAAAAILVWLLSMGRYFEPLYRLVFMLPIGDSIRAPVKWHHLTEFCLCVLAGFGLESLRQRLVASGRLKPLVASLCLGAIAVLGACDLARIDRLYCASVDLSIVQGANPAADEIVRRGGGAVADLIQGGSGTLAWSFRVSFVNLLTYEKVLYRMGVWGPQTVLLVGVPLLIAVRRRQERPSDMAYALIYHYVSYMPTWLLSGTRYTSAMYPLYLTLARMPRSRKGFAGLFLLECALLAYMTVVGLWFGHVM